MTTAEKQEELIKRFGARFYNELGLRVTGAQQLQGRKQYKMDDNSITLANKVTEALWKEWVETEFTCDMCAEKRTGQKHDVYNENHVIQEGLVECDVCMSKRLTPHDTPPTVST